MCAISFAPVNGLLKIQCMNTKFSMIAQIRILMNQSRMFFSTSRKEYVTPESNMVFWTPDGESFMLQT